MISGDQWLCPCGTSNLFLRRKCRECAEPRLPDETFEPWEVGMERVMARNRRDEDLKE